MLIIFHCKMRCFHIVVSNGLFSVQFLPAFLPLFRFLDDLAVAGIHFIVIIYHYLPPTKEEVYVFACTHAFVCLSVCVQDYSKTRSWIWMKCCMSTDVGTWTNWLTFELDPDHIPDAGTGFTPNLLTQLFPVTELLNFSGISQQVMDGFR